MFGRENKKAEDLWQEFMSLDPSARELQEIAESHLALKSGKIVAFRERAAIALISLDSLKSRIGIGACKMVFAQYENLREKVIPVALRQSNCQADDILRMLDQTDFIPDEISYVFSERFPRNNQALAKLIVKLGRCFGNKRMGEINILASLIKCNFEKSGIGNLDDETLLETMQLVGIEHQTDFFGFIMENHFSRKLIARIAKSDLDVSDAAWEEYKALKFDGAEISGFLRSKRWPEAALIIAQKSEDKSLLICAIGELPELLDENPEHFLSKGFGDDQLIFLLKLAQKPETAELIMKKLFPEEEINLKPPDKNKLLSIIKISLLPAEARQGIAERLLELELDENELEAVSNFAMSPEVHDIVINSKAKDILLRLRKRKSILRELREMKF